MPIVFEALEVSSVSDLVPRVYERAAQAPHRRPRQPRAARARRRRRGGGRLIDAGAQLALAARAVARRDPATDPSPSCWRGAFRPPRWWPLETHLDLPGARPALLKPSPRGAPCALALDLLQS
jgi:hypothetical protein